MGGMEHPDVANSCFILGWLLEENNDFDGAKGMFRRSLMIFEKSLGMEHPTTITARNRLQRTTSQVSTAGVRQIAEEKSAKEASEKKEKKNKKGKHYISE